MDGVTTALFCLISAAVLAVLLVALAGPPEAWDIDEGQGLLGRLRKRKDRLLRAIKDLEFEHENGMLSREEFQKLRGQYKVLAIRAMQALDRVRSARLRRIHRSRVVPGSARAEVERLVRERRARDAEKQEGRAG